MKLQSVFRGGFAVCVLLSVTGPLSAAEAKGARPNFLCIIADDLATSPWKNTKTEAL